MEPHYKLPFLSYLPPALADRYVRASGRADHYYERFRTRRGLRRMLRGLPRVGLHLPGAGDADAGSPAPSCSPARWAAWRGRCWPARPAPVLRLLLPVVPTYLWVATKTPRRPAGAALPQPPEPVRPPVSTRPGPR